MSNAKPPHVSVQPNRNQNPNQGTLPVFAPPAKMPEVRNAK